MCGVRRVVTCASIWESGVSESGGRGWWGAVWTHLEMRDYAYE